MKKQFLKKFVIGVREHKDTDFWDINYQKNIKEEAIDLYWYASGLGGFRGFLIKLIAILIYYAV